MRRRRAVAALAAVAVAGGAAAAVWAFALRDGAEPLSVAEALAAFRADDGESAVAGAPTPGVYVYRTSGFEEIDALVGSRHDYPPETTITARGGGCGATLAWNAFGGRSTTWEICSAGGGWSLAGYRETHRFFGQTEQTEYRCDGSAWLPAEGEGAGRSCTTGETDERSRVTVVEDGARLDVGGTQVTAAHVRVELELTGRTVGQGAIEAWLLPSGLPARLVIENDNASESPIGEVRYTERAELELLSLEPRR